MRSRTGSTRSNPNIRAAAAGLFLLGLILGASVPALAGTRVVGRTYAVAEPDFLAEVQERARAVDWKRLFDRDRWRQRFYNYRPRQLARLPRAKEDRVRFVTPTAELPFDVPGPDGRIAYPKGYRFNPLDHITLTYHYLVLDADDPDQVEWAKTLAGLRDPKLRVLLSGGNYWEAMKALGVRVYYLTRPFAERLDVRAAPSLVRQEGNQLRIQEFAVPNGLARGNPPPAAQGQPGG